MNNADLIVRTLREAGVRHGFGIPSGNVLPLLEAMRTGGLEFVLTAHEGSAAFAADVMGRLTYFGVPTVGVRTPEALAKALREALDADHPVVVEAVIDPSAYGETVYD